MRGACRPADLVLKPPHLRESANRHASRLLALLVAIMLYPLAYELAVLESQQGAPVYSLASVL